MSTMKLKQCPKCGGPIPPEAPQGLCPRCLMAQATIPTEAGDSGSARPSPPALSEVAPPFRNLKFWNSSARAAWDLSSKPVSQNSIALVALKILPQSLATDARFAERFTREGRSWRAQSSEHCHHP